MDRETILILACIGIGLAVGWTVEVLKPAIRERRFSIRRVSLLMALIALISTLLVFPIR